MFIPKIEYVKTGSTIFLSHSKVPVELEGSGISSVLVKPALKDITLNNFTFYHYALLLPCIKK